MTPHHLTVRLAGTTLTYTATPGVKGEGCPVLLLHPWFGCAAFWVQISARLAAPSYAVDWYSLGNGDWSQWASPGGLCRAIHSLVNQLRLDRVDIVGNSVGGIVAQLFAAAHPGRVRRLILVGTGANLGGPPTDFGKLVSAWIDHPQTRHRLVGTLVDSLVATPLPEAERMSYVRAVQTADPDFISAVLAAARDLDLTPELGHITAPTLVIRGERDSARTPAHTAALLSGIPEARAVEMSGCGHSPMIEQPDRFAALVNDHLADGRNHRKPCRTHE